MSGFAYILAKHLYYRFIEIKVIMSLMPITLKNIVSL